MVIAGYRAEEVIVELSGLIFLNDFKLIIG